MLLRGGQTPTVADEELDDVADRLYALAPEDFTAARDAEARRAGSRQLRAQVMALRRPTVSAWVVDRLAREQPDLFRQLLDLGPAMAVAQREGQGQALRALGHQRRELVAAVTATAVDLAGRDLTPQVRTEVEQTLEAALADPAAADAVRSGRLVRPLSYAGFGDVDVTGAVAVTVAVPSEGRKQPPREDDGGDEQRALDAAAALDDAVRACERAARRRDAAERREADAGDAADAASAQVRRLEQELAAAREREVATRAALAASQAEVQTAAREAAHTSRAVVAAQEAVEAARASLDRRRRG
jgi:hypothetical protein